MSSRTRRASRKQSDIIYSRRLLIEWLEDRRLLAVFTVDTELDVVNLTDGLMSLREAVFITNSVSGADTINFAASLQGKTIALNQGELAITGSLTINGLGEDQLTIDASDSDLTPDENNGDGSRIFRIDDGDDSTFIDVAISGLKLTGGDVGSGGSGIPFDGGGAIASSEYVSVTACTISGNFASESGGGVSNTYGDLTLAQCTISDNSTVNFGGGVLSFQGNLNIAASTINGNRDSLYGGGIWILNGNLTISDSEISNNTGSGVHSSATFQDPFTTNLIRTSISGNTANFGGGIDAAFVDVTVTDSTISGNTALGYGGGISAQGSYLGNSVTVTNTLISNNMALSGGGVYGRYISVALTGSEVRSNSASGDGGGICARYANVAVNNSTISANTAENGGGLWVESVFGASANILNSTISGNTASGMGGGIYGHYGPMTVTNSTVSDNQSNSDGAGIHSVNNRLTVSRSTISGNTGGDFAKGGGIFSRIGDLVVANSTLSGNSAFRGGGIYSLNNYAHVVDSTISGNAAHNFGYGGGISHRAGSLTIARSTITLNQALNVGGVNSFPNGFTHTTVEGSIISGNQNGDVGNHPGTINSFVSNGFNLIGTGSAISAFNQLGDQTGITDPMLAALANNGGPTKTHALLPASPALDAGDPSAAAGVAGMPQYDQRGAPFTRVFDGDGSGGAQIDIGAFELESAVLPPALPGDYNIDGVVDAADYIIWRKTLGSEVANYSGADGSGNGSIGPEDHGVWAASFGQTLHGSIRGRVHAHTGPDCDFDNPEILLEGVRIDLLDGNGNFIRFTLTDANGEYAFAGLAPGIFQVREHQPTEYYDGGERIGTAGGAMHDVPGVFSVFTGINITSNLHATQYDFCEHIGVTLSGNVYHDRSNDGVFDRPTEEGIGGVVVKLLDASGNDTGLRATTNSNGYYEFTNLAADTYAVMEVHPAGWLDGIDTPGNLGGVSDLSPPGDMISQIAINWGETGFEYNFGERLPAPEATTAVIDHQPQEVIAFDAVRSTGRDASVEQATNTQDSTDPQRRADAEALIAVNRQLHAHSQRSTRRQPGNARGLEANAHEHQQDSALMAWISLTWGDDKPHRTSAESDGNNTVASRDSYFQSLDRALAALAEFRLLSAGHDEQLFDNC